MEDTYERVLFGDRYIYPITESSFSRLAENFESSPFFIISAYRGGKKYGEKNVENRKNTSLLLKDIKDAGLGAKSLIGGYVETETYQEKEKREQLGKDYSGDKNVKEYSFFVPYVKSFGSLDKFRQFALDLMVKYDQNAILYSYGKEDGGLTRIVIMYPDSSEEGISSGKFTLSVDKVRDMYSQVKGKKFVFESTNGYKGVFEGMLLNSVGLVLFKDK